MPVTDSDPPRTRITPRQRLLLAAVFLTVAIGALILLPLDDWLASAVDWTRVHPVAGVVLFLLISVVGCVLFLPGSVIAMSAGYVYGLWMGSPLALLGLSLGAFAAFMNGRWLVRGWVFSMLESHPRLKALDQAVYSRSFLIVFLTRLSLVIPFNVLNYVYGVTGVKKIPYVVATLLGMIPPAVLWTYLGTLARDFQDIRHGALDADLPGGVILAAGLVMIVAVVVIVHRTASRALNQYLPE